MKHAWKIIQNDEDVMIIDVFIANNKDYEKGNEYKIDTIKIYKEDLEVFSLHFIVRDTYGYQLEQNELIANKYIITNGIGFENKTNYIGLREFTIEQVKLNISSNFDLNKGNIKFLRNELEILERLYNNDTYVEELISLLNEFEFNITIS